MKKTKPKVKRTDRLEKIRASVVKALRQGKSNLEIKQQFKVSRRWAAKVRKDEGIKTYARPATAVKTKPKAAKAAKAAKAKKVAPKGKPARKAAKPTKTPKPAPAAEPTTPTAPVVPIDGLI